MRLWIVYLNQAAILGNYNDILRSCNALDYHDLISCSVKLLTDFPEGLNLSIVNLFLTALYVIPC